MREKTTPTTSKIADTVQSLMNTDMREGMRRTASATAA